MLNSVSWKSNNNAYERKQYFKIVSSVRFIASRALTATFRGLAMCLKRTVNLGKVRFLLGGEGWGLRGEGHQ